MKSTPAQKILRARNPYSDFAIRVLDVVVSLGLILFVFSWLGGIIALAIKLTSKGRVFFRQERMGMNGVPFELLKFRTMRPNRVSNILQASNEDPRITNVGAFLRKSGLDEIPQLFNILSGEMSLVGPRPFMLYHNNLYKSKVQDFDERLSVKPGLTGWAQVNGLRGEITSDYMLRRWISMDLIYVSKRSLYFNILILFRTFYAILMNPKSEDYKSKLTELLQNRRSSFSLDPNRKELLVLKTMSYFDIFKFPLMAHEIERSLFSEETMDVEEVLLELMKKGIVFKSGDYYSLRNESALVSARIQNEERADRYLKKAPLFVRIISSFPFTRAVFISGSLSKGAVGKKGDIDYFIVTGGERLWLNRTLLILFKKLFLLNSKKFFCINYFVSEEAMEIPDKNQFTATEVAHLIPVYNKEVCDEFMRVNSWYKEFLPNFSRNVDVEILEGQSSMKLKFERWLSGPIGESLDDYFFKLTLNRWRKKFGHMTDEDFALALRSKKYVSKHHPSNFQDAVLSELDMRMSKFTGEEKTLNVA